MRRSRNNIAVPPGATIKEQLTDRGMSQKEFACRMDMSEKHISRLINGDVILTPEVALRLETVLGVPAGFWNNLEAIYREKLLRIDLDNKTAHDIDIARRFPYQEMVELKWISAAEHESDMVQRLRQFFGVVDLKSLENRQISKILCHDLSLGNDADLVLMVWAQEARSRINGQEFPPLNTSRLERYLQEIKSIVMKESGISREAVADILLKCGIALVLLPYLRGLNVNSAALSEQNHLIIAIRDDQDTESFRFELFRELAHVLLGHCRNNYEVTVEDEVKAEAWARQTLK